MNNAWILCAALVLDAAFGEPDWIWSRIPHPAVLMGRTVGWFDKHLNNGTYRKAKGVIALTILISIAYGIGAFFESLQIGAAFEIIIAAVLIAHRSLVDHVAAVATALRQSIDKGRTEVAKIVGRDTAELDETAIVRATIESAAENLSDGVIAPAFWFLVFGLPGLLIYKITNTADSMIGYRTPRHSEFGWAAARFDDLINLIPARLTALLIAIARLNLGALKIVGRDAKLHRSPNAGWPEAAVAAVQGIALSGPRSYNGKPQDFPFVHPEGRHALTPVDIEETVTTLWRTWCLSILIVAVLAFL